MHWRQHYAHCCKQLFFAGFAGRMTAKEARRGEFAELMPNHVFRNVDRQKLMSVMNGNRMSNEIRCNRTASRPGFHRSFLIFSSQRLYFCFQFGVYVRSFFQGTGHLLSPSLYD